MIFTICRPHSSGLEFEQDFGVSVLQYSSGDTEDRTGRFSQPTPPPEYGRGSPELPGYPGTSPPQGYTLSSSPPPDYSLGTSPTQTYSLADVGYGSPSPLPGYPLAQPVSESGSEFPPTSHPPLSLYRISEVGYVSSTPTDQPAASPSPTSLTNLKFPVLDLSDPRLDLSTGQVHIHLDLSTDGVLNLSSVPDTQSPGSPLLESETLPTYYDMSSSVAMDDTEPAHSTYPYFNGGVAGATPSAALGSANSSSSSSSPYSLTNRAYSDPAASAYSLYSQYYGGAAYPYGMGSFTGSTGTGAGGGFGTKGDYSSYYGSYPSWTGNPYR